MRIIHFLVVCALIYAASYVYRIKMESTSRVERVQRLVEAKDAVVEIPARTEELQAREREKTEALVELTFESKRPQMRLIRRLRLRQNLEDCATEKVIVVDRYRRLFLQ